MDHFSQPQKTTKISKILKIPCFLTQNPYPQQGLVEKSAKCISVRAERRGFSQEIPLFYRKVGFYHQNGLFPVLHQTGIYAKTKAILAGILRKVNNL